MRLLPDIQLAETVKPKSYKLSTDFWANKIFAGNLDFQIIFVCFQFFQSGFRRWSEYSLLNGIEKILNACVGFL